MSVVEGLDEGDVWALAPVPIEPTDTLHSLWESMAHDGASQLVDVMQAGFTNPQPQVGESVYARKLLTSDSWLEWNRSAVELSRVIRVGRAWATINGERFKIHEAEVVDSNVDAGVIQDLVVGTGDGGLRLVTVQPAGKPRMDAEAWANGAQPNGTAFDAEQPNG